MRFALPFIVLSAILLIDYTSSNNYKSTVKVRNHKTQNMWNYECSLAGVPASAHLPLRRPRRDVECRDISCCLTHNSSSDEP